MKLVDSHCHLDQLNLSHYGDDLTRVLQQAREFSVEHILCVCITLENFQDVLDIAKNYPHISASLGVHPTEWDGKNPTTDELIALAQDTAVVAIGETGLDYFHMQGEQLNWQQERFRKHIAAAKSVRKPLIIHTRDAAKDTLQIMQEEKASDIGGVMHCFTENWDVASQAMDLGFYISLSGIVTFKNATAIQEVAKKMPLDRLLIETDAPYLAPTPYRGKPNVPAYVRYVAEFLAQLRDEPLEKIAEATTANFFKLFPLASFR